MYKVLTLYCNASEREGGREGGREEVSGGGIERERKGAWEQGRGKT